MHSGALVQGFRGHGGDARVPEGHPGVTMHTHSITVWSGGLVWTADQQVRSGARAIRNALRCTQAAPSLPVLRAHATLQK